MSQKELMIIKQAFEMLAGVRFRRGYLGAMEAEIVNAHLEAVRPERASYLLATRGPDAASEILRCSRSQVYCEAKKVQEVDELKTA